MSPLSDPEIGRKPFRRIIMNEPVVFYRTEDGTPVALEDRCPHRRLPLSMGKLVGDDILQCHYHGLRFDRTGACVRVPGQDMIPARRAGQNLSGGRSLQVAVDLDGRSGAGRSRQDPRLPLVRRSELGRQVRLSSTRKCNWQLVNDNLLDLTHLAFVHETTIGNMALVEHAAVSVKRTPDGVQVTRWIIDQPAPPAFVKIGGFTGNVDRWQIIDYMPPSYIRLDVGATPTGTGAPEGRRVGGIQMRNLNAMTPETETTTHYFWGQAHDFEPHNAEMTERVFQQIKTAFLEDV